jgi:hypothetical protein
VDKRQQIDPALNALSQFGDSQNCYRIVMDEILRPKTRSKQQSALPIPGDSKPNLVRVQ